MSTENGTTGATLAGTAEDNTTFESKGKGKAAAESEDHPMGEAGDDDEDDDDEDEAEVSLNYKGIARIFYPSFLRITHADHHAYRSPKLVC